MVTRPQLLNSYQQSAFSFQQMQMAGDGYPKVGCVLRTKPQQALLRNSLYQVETSAKVSRKIVLTISKKQFNILK